MKTHLSTVCLLFTTVCFCQHTPWPVLKHYEKNSLDRIAMPVGGVGTGDLSLGGNGEWKEIEIINKPGMGFFGSVTSKRAPCFMVFVKEPSGRKSSKALLGPVASYEYE